MLNAIHFFSSHRLSSGMMEAFRAGKSALEVGLSENLLNPMEKWLF
jgi:hypothetical protein